MKKHEIIVSETGLSPEIASDILITLIDNQITNYNRIKFIEWERNNKNSTLQLDKTMKHLLDSKFDLKQKLTETSKNQSKISYSISIEISVD